MDGSDAISTGIAPVTGLDITGAWHFADCLLTYANGKTQRPWASSASGYLIYSPNGHMCKSLNYPTPSGQIDCISYCGHYEIAADRVFHSIAIGANIREVGTVLEKTVSIENHRLLLKVSPAAAGGPGSTMQYIWNRAAVSEFALPSTPRALP